MLYKYEMHVHDSLCSHCGHNPPEVIAKVYYDRGYAGMCFTNHFLQGSTAIDKTLPWEDKVRAYWNAYLRVKDWAKDKDFDILFGLEHHYGSGKEVLTYGIDLDFLLAHPNIDVASIKDYCDAVHEAGGFISQAHPFRRAPYIDPNVLPQPELWTPPKFTTPATPTKTTAAAMILQKKIIFTAPAAAIRTNSTNQTSEKPAWRSRTASKPKKSLQTRCSATTAAASSTVSFSPPSLPSPLFIISLSERNPHMESLKELYRIGTGPSSSHTMGPERAAHRFKEKYPQADRFLVTLYGSLAKTGKGHLTDDILVKTFAPLPVEIRFDLSDKPLPHPNTLELTAIENDKEIGFERVMSVGGGKILSEGETEDAPADVYPLSTFADIKAYCASRHMRLWQYAEECEGTEIWDYLKEVWRCMREAVTRGLETEGTLKGGLDVQRKAKMLYRQNHIDESAETRENRLVCAYAYAVSEENAAGGIIVTAPTCGSCGVLPSVLLYMQERRGFTDTEILHALAAGGIIGNLIKTNASISGAECGCQAEIGSACSMAAAALAELHGMELDQIEYAAEVAMEHHLGLTCDPVRGLVQIPCIERNAVAAMRAINALSLANFLTYTRKISFDVVVNTMYETGRDLFSKYRETGEGGLAKYYTGKK